MLSLEPIRQALRRHPFVPFRIHSADGTQYEVAHPECAAIVDNGRYLVVDRGWNGHAMLDRLLVSAVVYTQVHETPPENGIDRDPEAPRASG